MCVFICVCLKVRSFGTEDRPTDRPVLPRDEVFEYIIFRGADIEDLHVCEPYPAQSKPNTLPPSLIQDPAIVKTSAGPVLTAPSSTSTSASTQQQSVVVGSSSNSTSTLPSSVSSATTQATVGQQVLAAVSASASVGSQRRSPTADSSVQVDSDMNYNNGSRQQQQQQQPMQQRNNRQQSNDHYGSSSSSRQQQNDHYQSRNNDYNQQRNSMNNNNQQSMRQQSNGHSNYDNNNRNNRMSSGYGQQQQQNDYRREMSSGLNDRNNLGGGNYNQVSSSQSNGFRRMPNFLFFLRYWIEALFDTLLDTKPAFFSVFVDSTPSVFYSLSFKKIAMLKTARLLKINARSFQ